MIGEGFCCKNRFQRRRLHAMPCETFEGAQVEAFNEIVAESVEGDQHNTLLAVRVAAVRMRASCQQTTRGDEKLYHN